MSTQPDTTLEALFNALIDSRECPESFTAQPDPGTHATFDNETQGNLTGVGSQLPASQASGGIPTPGVSQTFEPRAWGSSQPHHDYNAQELGCNPTLAGHSQRFNDDVQALYRDVHTRPAETLYTGSFEASHSGVNELGGLRMDNEASVHSTAIRRWNGDHTRPGRQQPGRLMVYELYDFTGEPTVENSEARNILAQELVEESDRYLSSHLIPDSIRDNSQSVVSNSDDGSSAPQNKRLRMSNNPIQGGIAVLRMNASEPGQTAKRFSDLNQRASNAYAKKGIPLSEQRLTNSAVFAEDMETLLCEGPLVKTIDHSKINISEHSDETGSKFATTIAAKDVGDVLYSRRATTARLEKLRGKSQYSYYPITFITAGPKSEDGTTSTLPLWRCHCVKCVLAFGVDFSEIEGRPRRNPKSLC
ncbi:uncharacterized protein IL334_006606 [Kwoniella shivajii]|uniref:Uncharacterized protein n=1 Tax=Kwoniella shivajii TaxID=564305 RepID=A0ABZ1D7M7_9TREE|nr:hypothetical protein IL334_006606 [Kwoniella shivajii]